MKCSIKKIVFSGISLSLCALLAFTGCAAKPTVSGSPSVAGAYAEMSSADFWLAAEKNPDKPLMTPAEVKEFTARIAQTEGTDCVALDTYPEMLDRDTLLQEIRLYDIPEEKRYIGDKELDKAYYEALIKNRNEAAAQAQNPVRFGVVVQNSQLRTWPTADVSYDLPNDLEFDLNYETILKTGERVAVLHISEDGQWLLTQAYNYQGWMRQEDIALTDRDTWMGLGAQTDWLVVTANRILLDQNNVTPAVSRKELTMGTRLPLVREKPEIVDGVSTVSSRVVKMPVRLASGELQMTDTRVPMNLDVSEGFLPYTPRSIITQSFKLLGERYGWSGLSEARDCSAALMDIYQCVGIDLPRNTAKQANVAGERIDVSAMSDADKQALILKQPVGTLLEMQGHIMLYLGSYEGTPYVLQQVNSFAPTAGDEMLLANCALVSNLSLIRKNGDTHLTSIRTINSLQCLN